MVLCVVAYESRYVIAATHRMTTSVLFLALTRIYHFLAEENCSARPSSMRNTVSTP
jgi:hypothetical protein